ncbi:MAG: divalent-cation tolerance protein CutA [Limnochordales bacterium]
MTNGMLVYITTPTAEEAQRLGRILVEQKLAACANIVPAIRSIYRWQGEIVEDGEALLLIKTTREAVEALIDCVKQNHSYTVPCITAFPIAQGNPDYLRWLEESVSVPAGER